MILLLPILMLVTLWPPYLNGPPIRSDGAGYHLWIRALLAKDLTLCKWREANVLISEPNPQTGVCQNPYQPGVALLQFPLMAPFVDLRPGAPVISPAEHRMCLVCGAIALLLVCWCLLSSIRKFQVSSSVANLAVVSFVFGTGLFHYATYDASFSHIYSAAGYALLCWLGVRGYLDEEKMSSVAVAVTCFFLVYIRSTNAVVICTLAAGWLLVDSNRRNRDAVASAIRPVIAGFLGSMFAVALILAYNYYATHHIQLNGYREPFLFGRPMQGSVLFSYERGLFTYYPVMGLALVVGALRRCTRLATFTISAIIGVLTTIYGFWISWFLGGGMGHRGFVEIAPFTAVLFAVSAGRLPSMARRFACIAAVVLAIPTSEVMWGYWQGSFPFGGATRETYVSHVFGKYSFFEKALARK